MSTPTANNWYAPTAYTASQKKDLAPPDPAAWKGGSARALRAHPLSIGVFCGDYRTDINIKEVEALKEGIVDPVPNHEYTEMGSMKNPKNLFASLQWLAGFSTGVGILTLIVIPPSPGNYLSYLYFIIPSTLFLIFTLARTLAPDKNDIVFNRRTGMVTFSYAKKDNVFGMLQWVAGTFASLILFSLLVSGRISFPLQVTEKTYLYLSFFVVPFALFLIFTLARQFAPDNNDIDRNNVVFNRRIGMVTIPFVELDAYYYCPQSTVGYKHTLYLGHRFSPLGFGSPSDWVDKQWLHAEWEYYQQFMDISLPLPDTPDFEPYRHLDPTTAAHDKEHNRPPNFWRNMSLEQVKKEQAEGTAVTRNFAWHKLPAANHIPKECMDRLLPGARLFK
ncbi:hypothetical protein Pcar_2831 [Syntrophotalea carbinolica DSM 2380]|uniref:Uncharacterized protein n=1 Tax=Syntrophotalea carbinolica (strain DSM 2380 / NBRC 103641 / GraBd1) TaxID=338963 RepID=Q3A0P1_SYNC1|nr:hypothetical protein [Syntrophotalea carbinolica]ABA90066.1 hypothetical protein Pcar_2831 [Syntrophotalea carbinolica DSM 2380]